MLLYITKNIQINFFLRNGCPVLIGKKEGVVILSSEKSGFFNYVDEYSIMTGNDIITLELSTSRNTCIISSAENHTYSFKKLNTNCLSLFNSPAPYKHWTIKEIHEQPLKINSLLHHYIRDRSININLNFDISLIEHVVFIGCGTSLYSGMIGAYTMQRLCNFVNVIHIDASEFEESMIPKSKHVLFIFVSQSGETKDVHHVLERL